MAVGVCVGDVKNWDEWEFRDEGGRPRIVGRMAKEKKKIKFRAILNCNDTAYKSAEVDVLMFSYTWS